VFKSNVDTGVLENKYVF